MDEVSTEAFDALLDQAETDLLDLSERVTRAAVVDRPYETAVLALGTRAGTLFHGSVVLFGSEVPMAALVLMRAAVEINLILRFLDVDTELHTELWIAEGERQTLAILREVEADPNRLGMPGPLPPGLLQEREALVAAVRKRALAAKVVGVGEKGPVMPSTQTIAHEYGDAATRQAYTLAFRPLSATTHATSRGFEESEFASTPDGHVAFKELSDREGTIRLQRSLNATTFASTLQLLDKVLRVGVADGAEVVYARLMTTTLSQ